MSSTPSFLGLPAEIRLLVYSYHLSAHRRITHDRQPSNLHVRLLRTCKQINAEAKSTILSYISLLHEEQIGIFLKSFPDDAFSLVQYVDVANDGRLLATSEKEPRSAPLSRLHIALRKLYAMMHLRVFECRQGLPISIHSSKRFVLAFEDAMFPVHTEKRLLSYELYLSSNTRVLPFRKISPSSVTTLRLSGECYLPAEIRMPALRDVVIQSVTGNYFDRHTFDQCFSEADLRSFSYVLGERIAFEIRDHHLQSLWAGPGRHLRRLVLLGCSRLSSAALADCLGSMPQLEYFALSLTTVEEQRTNFVLTVPNSVSVFKLHVVNAWYAAALLVEERAMCDAVESHILSRQPPPEMVALHFRAALVVGEGRQVLWEKLAASSGITLCVGPWEEAEVL